MTNLLLIAALAAHGCRLQAHDGNLRVVGPTGFFTSKLRSLITHCKPELVALLGQEGAEESGACNVSPADLPGIWVDEWEERAGIMEYDGGLLRDRAEAEALRDILRQMGWSIAGAKQNA